MKAGEKCDFPIHARYSLKRVGMDLRGRVFGIGSGLQNRIPLHSMHFSKATDPGNVNFRGLTPFLSHRFDLQHNRLSQCHSAYTRGEYLLYFRPPGKENQNDPVPTDFRSAWAHR